MMRCTTLPWLSILAVVLVSCRPANPPGESPPTRTPTPARAAAPTPEHPASTHTPTPEPGPKRLDSEYPLPPLEPGVSDVPGVRIVDWGYRFTQPGTPENSILIQARVANQTEREREVLVVVGLEHGVPWALPQSAWFRVDMLPMRLAASEEKRLTVEFPELQSIHLGVKAGFYVPRVLVREPGDFNDDANAVEGVRILEWNYTVVARPRGPHPAEFIAVIRNLDRSPKRIVLRTELIPKPGAEGYDGPPEGFEEDHAVEIPAGQDTFLAVMPMLSTSGISRTRAPLLFDAGVHIMTVQRL